MAAAVGASRPGYNSDEEVYNTARAVDEAGGLVFDADGNQVIVGEADSRKVRLHVTCRWSMLDMLVEAKHRQLTWALRASADRAAAACEPR